MSTKDQLRAARAIAEIVVAADNVAVLSPAKIQEALRVLLAATAEPTNNELDVEARAAYPANTPESSFCRGAYKRGARREGLR